MNTTWIARFADEPALIAPHMAGRFQHCLAALESGNGAKMLADAQAASNGGDFWTELGDLSPRLRPYVIQDGVLEIPVKGVLLHDFPLQLGGWATGYEYIRKAVERGLADDNVAGIAFIHDSPGGMVAGNFDLVDMIYQARGQKPMQAFAAESAYSAAYSLASAADRIVVARTGGVGSIGVVTMHLDMSKAFDEMGFKITFIHFGAHKVDGNPYEPLPDDVRKRIQAQIDGLGALFVDTVARNRNLSAAAVRATEALTFTASEALENGLADAVGSLDGALAEFAADLTNTDTGDETMSDPNQAVTVDSLKADHPKLTEALIAEGVEQGKTAAEAENGKAIETALAADRARIAEIRAIAEPGAEKIVDAGIASGASAADVALEMQKSPDVKAARKKAAMQAGIEGDEAAASGITPSESASDPAQAAVPQTEAGWTAEWEAAAEDSAIRREFPKAKYYVAHKKLEARAKAA